MHTSTEPYKVHVIRDGKFWFITIEGVTGATQARNVAEIEPMARDYISIVEGVPEESIVLDTHIQLPQVAEENLSRANQLRIEAAAAQANAAEASRAAARYLKEDGLTTREIGSLLGISHQRAHQLVSS